MCHNCEETMNILQISANDNRIGGASGVALKIKEGLEKRNISNSIFCGVKSSNTSNVIKIPKKKIDRIKSLLFADDMSFFKTDFILETKEFKDADIVHCHNLHGWYFNLETLRKMSQLKPVIWTFHDLWPVTPHCAYTFNEKIEDGFYKCPSLKLYPPLLWHNEKKLTNIKRDIYNDSPFHIVVPSMWLKEKLNDTVLKNKPTHLIYNGIDTQAFIPKNKEECRIKLGLPLDKKIILFISNNGVKTDFKGGGFFLQVSKDFLTNDSTTFLCLGGNKNEKVGNINFIQKTTNEETLASYFSAADILLYPSLADNFPLIILEAMSCGLPIVTFGTGGIKEAVIDKINGYIAKYEDTEDLVVGIKYVLNLNKNDLQKMSRDSRERVINFFNMDKMITEYLELYESILIKK